MGCGLVIRETHTIDEGLESWPDGSSLADDGECDGAIGQTMEVGRRIWE